MLGRSMTWRMLALLLVLALVAAACGDAEDDDGNGDDVGSDVDGLRLGYILPETGPLAFLGPPQVESAKLAVEDINDAGGGGGRT